MPPLSFQVGASSHQGPSGEHWSPTEARSWAELLTPICPASDVTPVADPHLLASDAPLLLLTFHFFSPLTPSPTLVPSACPGLGLFSLLSLLSVTMD